MSKMLNPALAAALVAAAPIARENEPEATEEVTMTEPTVPVSTDHATALADILKRMRGVQDTGYTLVDEYVDKLWAQGKLSKIEAARQGLDSRTHNPALWGELQNLRSSLKASVRKHCREGAFVAPKIARATQRKADATEASEPTPVRTPEIDALLLKHAGDPAVEALAKLLGL